MQNVECVLRDLKVKEQALLEEQKSLPKEIEKLKEELERFFAQYGADDPQYWEKEREIEKKTRRLKYIGLFELPHLRGYIDQFEKWQSDKELEKKFNELVKEFEDLFVAKRKLEAQMLAVRERIGVLEGLGVPVPTSKVRSHNHCKVKFRIEPYAWKGIKSLDEVVCNEKGCDCEKLLREATKQNGELHKALTTKFRRYRAIGR